MIDHCGNRLFKYNYVVARLRRDIRDGRFGPEGRIPPERQLSEEYVVSRVTLRAALKQLRAEGVIDQRQGSGTFLRPQTSSGGKRKRKYRVLLFGKEPRFAMEVDPYYSQLFLGFYRYQSTEFEFTFDARMIPLAEGFTAYIERCPVKFSDYDGVLCAFPLNERELDGLDREGVPYVFLGCPNILRNVPTVDIDNYQGMAMTAECLLQRGCTRPLLLYNGYSQPNLQTRLAGYHAALERYDCEIDPRREIEVGDKVSDDAERAVDSAIRDGVAFDSVLAVCDWPALGACQALKRHRLRVPDQIKLAVFDGFPWLLEGMRPHPTAIIQPFALMAEKALELLAHLPENQDIITHILIRPVLVNGETV